VDYCYSKEDVGVGVFVDDIAGKLLKSTIEEILIWVTIHAIAVVGVVDKCQSG
jgi:hypothetical protein